MLKNTARDWSEEGAAEREQSYGRIVRELSRLFASWPAGAEPPSVLVPGCGLGRLCLEITNQVGAAAGRMGDAGRARRLRAIVHCDWRRHVAAPWSVPWTVCSPRGTCPWAPSPAAGLLLSGQRVQLFHAAGLGLPSQRH